MYYLGFDIGTSSLKTTVMDDHLNIVYEFAYDYIVSEPKEGYREIDPSLWFDAVIDGMADIFSHIDTDKVSVIGVTGQMHTTVFLDAKGHSIRPAIMWNDLRTADRVKEIKETMNGMEEVKYIQRIISAGSPAMNTLWVKENEPDNFNEIVKIMTSYDYIVYRLTGKFSCDFCDASTSSMYDIVNKCWSKYMLGKLGIAEDVLGPVHHSCDVIGVLTKEIKKNFHLKKDIRVIAGTGDNPATATAMGILNKSTPVISLGTSGVLILPKKDGEFEGRGKNVLFNAKGDSFVDVVQGVVQSAGGTHRWWVRNILKSEDFSVDQDDINSQTFGHNSVLFFPHITGEKTIYADSTLRGAFFGLSGYTQRKDMTQAVFEGIGFAFRDLLENMGLNHWPEKIQANGGGTKSRVWMEILSNILNVEIEVDQSNATPGFGVCLLAYLSEHQSIEMKQKSNSLRYIPDKEVVSRYAKKYKKYKKIYQIIKELDHV